MLPYIFIISYISLWIGLNVDNIHFMYKRKYIFQQIYLYSGTNNEIENRATKSSYNQTSSPNLVVAFDVVVYKLVEINETDQGYKQRRKSIWLPSFLFNAMVFYS